MSGSGNLCILAAVVFALCVNYASGDCSAVAATKPPCRVLPPKPKRTSVAGERNVSISHLLNGGSEAMIAMMSNISAWPTDAILILGNTGSGKTTLTQIITSDLTRIHTLKTSSGGIVIMDDEERIGAPSTLSRTLIPELVTYKGTDNSVVYFYDCPGFDDTRGPEQDLAANFFVNQIIRNVARVKMLFLVTYSSVKMGNDKLDFNLLAKHATTFVKNMSLFENSIGLVVTKVPGFNEQRDCLEESQIMAGILEFLSDYNQTQHNELTKDKNPQERDRLQRILSFVHILLKPHRVQFYRSPEVCGPLSTSVFAKKARAEVTNLYNSFVFSSVGSHTNFGYTLKDATRESVHTFTNDINRSITQEITQLMASISQWFEQEYEFSKGDLSCILDMLGKSDFIATNITAGQLPDSCSEFSNELSRFFAKVDYNVPASFRAFMAHQSEYLNFFDEATGSRVARALSDWLNPILKLQEEQRVWKKIQIDNVTNQVNQAISQKIDSILADFTQWFEGQSSQKADILSRVQFIQRTRLRVDTLEETISEFPTEFASTITEALSGIGFAVEASFQSYMSLQEGHLKTLDELSGSKVFRGVEKWRMPIQKFKRYYNQWLSSTLQNLAREINEAIEASINNLMGDFVTWFDNTKFTKVDDFLPLVKELERDMTEYEKLQVVEKANAGQTGTILYNAMAQMGYPVSSQAGDFITKIRSLSECLEILDLETGSKILRQSENWWSNISRFQTKLQNYLTWYTFCQTLISKLNSYSFHAQTLPNIDKNLGRDAYAFVQRHNLVPLSAQLTKINEDYKVNGERHRAILAQKLSWYVTSTQFQCQGDLLQITGHFILLSSFINPSGKLTQCSAATRLKVYAADTVFVDRNLDAIGQEMLFSLIAPKWEVVSTHLMNFDGANAIDKTGKTCPNGQPGNPGGPAGSFYGKAGLVVGAPLLRISVKGGNGGKGQDGCDGGDGAHGTTTLDGGGGFSMLGFSRSENCMRGTAGANGVQGGNGGAGGFGGNSGVVDISEKYISQVTVEKSVGKMGSGGRGGIGGRGGAGTTTQCCSSSAFLGFQLGNDCEDGEILSSGSRGTDGVDGRNMVGRVAAAPAKSLGGFAGVAEYKQIYAANVSHVTQKFISQLV